MSSDRIRQLENRVKHLEQIVRQMAISRGGTATAARTVLAMGAVSGLTGTDIVDPSDDAPADPLTVGSGTVKLLTINAAGQVEYMLDESGSHVTRTAISIVTGSTAADKMLALGRLGDKQLLVTVEDCG